MFDSSTVSALRSTVRWTNWRAPQGASARRIRARSVEVVCRNVIRTPARWLRQAAPVPRRFGCSPVVRFYDIEVLPRNGISLILRGPHGTGSEPSRAPPCLECPGRFALRR